jgi:AcrR family transcriptional regulator
MTLRSIEPAPTTPSAVKRRRAPIDKFGARRVELAEAALATLGELGYARTSLREIAENTQFTHGVFHYYFSDKNELICFCVSHYKARCVTRYDEVVANARTRETLMAGFLDKLADTIHNEAPMHRLWYDLRAQALFEDAFRDDVLAIDRSLEAMVWRIVTRYAELGGKRPILSASAFYAIFDGLFQKALLKHFAGDESAIAALLDEVKALLPMAA